jgi:hypothetical protein
MAAGAIGSDVTITLPMRRYTEMTRLLRWAGRSMWGHVVFFELIVALPFALFGLVSNATSPYFTAAFVLEMFFEVVGIAAVGGVVIWYVVTSPLIKKGAKGRN